MPSLKERKLENSPHVSSLDLPDIVTRIQQLGNKEDSFATIRKMIHLLNFDISELKNSGQDKPSFSGATWKTVAPAHKWLDVYQARDSHEREAARVRLMDAVRISS